ncbi:MAG: sigma-70 family RNA polymerase sigma factor [Rhodothermales bacterium]
MEITNRLVRRTEFSHSNLMAQLTELPDEDLIAHFQSGTVEAFNLIVDRYSNRLGSYLYNFVHDWDKAEDLLQETFIRVYRNRFAYTPIARFSTWIYTIAGNLARSEYRKVKSRKTQSLEAMGAGGETFDIPLPDEQFAADLGAEDRVYQDQISRALDKLTPAFQEAIILRDIQQLTYDEIAQITGLPMGTVKSRINRARTKLQSLLKPIYMAEA